MSARIVGYGETDVGEVPGYSPEEMMMWASVEAVNDANIEINEIDGLWARPPYGKGIGSQVVPTIAEYLGITPIRWGGAPALGGGSYVQGLADAVAAIEQGWAETILIVGGDTWYSKNQKDDDMVESLGSIAGEFEEPAHIIPSLYAFIASKYMNEFDVPIEKIAKISEIEYKHASMQRDERAHMNEPKSIGEILDSPMIADPLTMRQCSLISDGGAAIVVTSDEKANNCTDVPIKLAGFGGGYTHKNVTQMPDLLQTGAVEAGNQAMKSANVDHDEIDYLSIYDCFTIVVVRVLEDLGFCDIGKGGELAMSGELELGGKWPLNTHGGAIAHAHPGPTGLFHITEAIRQLQGKAEKAQVEGAETALVHNNGGIMSTQTVAILERE